MSRVKPATAALLGFAQGFLGSLLEGFQTERARKAKMLEAQELRAIEQQYRLEDRADEQRYRQQEREDQQAFNADQRAADEKFRAEITEKELKARERLTNAEIAARRETNREDIAARERIALMSPTSQIDRTLYQLYQMPGDPTLLRAPVGEKLPPGAVLYGSAGVDVDLSRSGDKGKPSPYGPGAQLSPKDAFFQRYTQPK